MMAGKVTRLTIVVVTALTLAIGALGVTSGVGLGWATPEVSAQTSGNGGTATGDG